MLADLIALIELQDFASVARIVASLCASDLAVEDCSPVTGSGL